MDLATKTRKVGFTARRILGRVTQHGGRVAGLCAVLSAHPSGSLAFRRPSKSLSMSRLNSGENSPLYPSWTHHACPSSALILAWARHASFASSALASCKSAVSKPSVNQP